MDRGEIVSYYPILEEMCHKGLLTEEVYHAIHTRLNKEILKKLQPLLVQHQFQEEFQANPSDVDIALYDKWIWKQEQYIQEAERLHNNQKHYQIK